MCKQIYTQTGIRGFYIGLNSLLLREVPGYFCLFGAYEYSRALLSSKTNNKEELGIILACFYWYKIKLIAKLNALNDAHSYFNLPNPDINSIGMGKIIVEFFSPAIFVNVCKYLSCSAIGDFDT